MSVRIGFLVVPQLPLSQQIQLGVMAENLGFDDLWFPDHLLFPDDTPCYDCWTVMTAIAAKTQRIHLGTAVSDVHRVPPAIFAQRAATLDQLSKGRVMVGLGSGEAMNLEPFGYQWQDRRVGRVREYIQVLRKLWDSRQPFDHDGKLYHMKRAQLTVHPYRDRRIPIFLAALGPQMQKMAADIADGWLPIFLPVEQFASFGQPLADALGGKPFQRCATAVFALIEEGQSFPDDVLARVARPFAGTLVWPLAAQAMGLDWNPPEHLREIGYSTVNPADPESLRLFDEFSQWIPDQVLTRFLLAGDKHVVLQRLREYVAAGATHLQIINVSPDPVYSLATLAHDIMPQLTGKPPTLLARLLKVAAKPLKKLGLSRKGVPEKLDVWKNVQST